VARRKLRRSHRLRLRPVLHAEADLHADLEVLDSSVFHVATDLNYFEPVHVTDRRRCTLDCIVNGRVDAIR